MGEYVVSVVSSAEPRQFTFEDVLRMVDAGVLDRDERVELLDGVLVRMSPEGLPHMGTGGLLSDLLSARYRDTEYRVRVNTTLLLDDRNFLAPDLLVREGDAFSWATADEAVLVIEVGHSSLSYDLGEKSRRYARWGAGTYWVVDVAGRSLVVHTDPVDGAYRSVVRIGEQEEVRLPRGGGRMRLLEVLPPV